MFFILYHLTSLVWACPAGGWSLTGRILIVTPSQGRRACWPSVREAGLQDVLTWLGDARLRKLASVLSRCSYLYTVLLHIDIIKKDMIPWMYQFLWLDSVSCGLFLWELAWLKPSLHKCVRCNDTYIITCFEHYVLYGLFCVWFEECDVIKLCVFETWVSRRASQMLWTGLIHFMCGFVCMWFCLFVYLR